MESAYHGISVYSLEEYKNTVRNLIINEVVLNNGLVVPEEFMRSIVSLSDDQWKSYSSSLVYWEEDDSWKIEFYNRTNLPTFRISIHPEDKKDGREIQLWSVSAFLEVSFNHNKEKRT